MRERYKNQYLNPANGLFSISLGKIFILLFSFLVICQPVYADNPEYEDISVFLRVQGIGGSDIDAIYNYNTNQLYLPINELFQFLRIKHEVSSNQDSIVGFVVDENIPYLVDYRNQKVQYGGTTSQLLDGSLLKTETGLYLDHTLFGKYFSLYCTFNFRGLSVELKTDLELPAIREIRLSQMRRNIEQLRGETHVDTVLRRDYHLLRFGMVDWAVTSTQSTLQREDTRFSIAAGTEVLGGETNLFLNYSTRDGFNNRSQQYFWRWANNDTKHIKQVRIGKINPGSIASVFDPVIGFSATNSPTSYRRSFGEYTITDYTEPGWSVELYINNVIVDYQKADASGLYSFNVPLVYGTSEVMLKFYGPYGEERISSQYISIPFNFLPKGELEYTVTGGVVLDGNHSLFGRAEANYGLNRFISFGAGYEYLSSIVEGEQIPFVTASFTPLRNLLIKGEYANGVRSRAIVSYRLPSNLMFELDYTNYVPDQKAIRFNYLEERRATLSAPLKLFFLKGFTRLSVKQNVYEILTYNTADLTLSTYMGPVNANLSAYANWIDDKTPFVYGNMALGIRLGKGFVFRPQSQVDITNSSIISVKGELEKRITRSGYFSLSGEENFRSGYRSIDFSLRWDLPFAQTNFSGRFTGKDISSTQGMRGSLAFGSGSNYVHKDNRTTIGRGGVTITPFIDLNHNGIQDTGEPIASGLRVKINGGRILENLNDSLIRVIELEPYTSYIFEFDDAGLEQIAWRIKHKTIQVYIDPNQFKKIDVPVLPMGEGNGWVYIGDQTGIRGQGRLVVNFFRNDGTFIAKTMTEADGGFTYLGLPPGELYAEIDSLQLSRLSLVADPPRINFNIEPLSYGDIVYDIEFILRRTDLPEESHSSELITAPESEPVQMAVKPEEEKIRESVTQEISIKTEIPMEIENNEKADLKYFALQAGAFSSVVNANELRSQLNVLVSWPVNMVSENGLNKIIIGQFQTREEAQKARRFLMEKGIESFVITFP